MTRHTLRHAVATLLLALLPLPAWAEPINLRLDGSTNPTAIDTLQPRLSWIPAADDPNARNVKQTAYHLLVASSPALLDKNQGDLWDTGRVASANSLYIPYAGKPLQSGQRAYWKVRAWTGGDQPSAWSTPATWIMGLLQPADWAPARWISAEGADPAGTARGYHAGLTQDANETKWVQIDLGQSRRIDAVRLFPMDHANVKGFGFPRGYKVEASDDPTFATATVLADRSAGVPSPGVNPVDIPADNLTARYVRVTANRLNRRNNGFIFALAELAVLSNGTNIAKGAPVSAKDSVEEFGWARTALTDGDTGDGQRPFASMLLRRDLAVRPALARATAFVTGLGHYELSINGKKVGDDLLSPGWTEYRKTVLYDAFDVTPLLRPGQNALGITLGNGMYNLEPTAGRYVKFTKSYGPLKAIAQVRLEYADGTSEIIGTDKQWHVAPGPITYNNVFGGEDFDARLASLWDQPAFTPTDRWRPALETDGPGGTLRGHSVAAPPIRITATHPPVSAKSLRPDVVIYDLGQNASHMIRLRARGPAGSAVRVIPAELLGTNGYVDRASSVQDAGGPAWWQLTLAGTGEESFFPKFFYQGCRYLQVELRTAPGAAPGATPELPTVTSLEGVVIHSSAEPIGTFECSNDLFNKTYALVRWAQRSNMMSVMTDCPQREKLGWLEQLHLNGPSLRYNFRLDNLFNKEMNDMRDAQLANGFVPNIAPEYFLANTDRLTDNFRNSPEWGSSFVIAPWQQYLFTGNDQLLRDYYPHMVRYVEFLTSQAKDNILTVGLGDWYDLGPKPPWGSQLTPPPFTGTAIYFYDHILLAQVADMLGKPDEAARFRDRAEVIRKAINARFFNPDKGNYATNSQCANAMAIALNIAEPQHRPAVLDALIADIRARGNALSAGDVGYRFVLRALADAGRSDVVFDMNNQTERPGYGMQIKKGATALTEKWDASVGNFGSQNHFMLGQINEWFFHDLAGIQYDPKVPGFAHTVIKPSVVGDVAWTRAAYDTNRGKIAVHWSREAGGIHLNVTIPPNTSATVCVPTQNPAAVMESNRPAATSPGITRAPDQPGFAVFTVGSGSYQFSAP